MKQTVYWDKQAFHMFSRAFDRVRRRSASYAVQAEDEILSKINQLVSDARLHPPDRYKRDNTGDFRAFELHRHRVSYFADEKAIIVLRIMHVRKRSR